MSTAAVLVFLWVWVGGIVAFVGILEYLFWKNSPTPDARRRARSGARQFFVGIFLPLGIPVVAVWLLVKTVRGVGALARVAVGRNE